MQIEIDTSDIDMMADIFQHRATWLVPSAMIRGQQRAWAHVRKARKRTAGERHYHIRRFRPPTPALIAHYVNHLLYLKFKFFWFKRSGRF